MSTSPFWNKPHDVFFQVGIHAAMQQVDPQIGKDLLAQLFVHLDRGFQFGLFVLLDHRIDDVDLMSGGDLLAHEFPDFRERSSGDAAGDDGRASGRHFVETLMSRSP